VTYQPSLSDGVGDYTFVANYGGDGVNTNAAATATCASPHPGAGQTETITLTGSVTSSSTQRYLPNDRVTLTSTAGTVMTGTLTVTLYSGSPTINATTGVCTAGAGTSPINGQSYSFSVLTSTNSASFNTSNTDPATSPNTTFYIGTKPDGNAGGSAGNYFWLIHYNGSGLTNPPDRCESSSVSINDAP
jgi:hypothetical protein